MPHYLSLPSGCELARVNSPPSTLSHATHTHASLYTYTRAPFPQPYADWNVPGVGTPFGDGMPHSGGLNMAVGSYNGGGYQPNASPPYNGNYAAPQGGAPNTGVPGGMMAGVSSSMPGHVAWQMAPPGVRPDKGMGGNGVPTRPVFPNAQGGSPTASFKATKTALRKASTRRHQQQQKKTHAMGGGSGEMDLIGEKETVKKLSGKTKTDPRGPGGHIGKTILPYKTVKQTIAPATIVTTVKGAREAAAEALKTPPKDTAPLLQVEPTTPEAKTYVAATFTPCSDDPCRLRASQRASQITKT